MAVETSTIWFSGVCDTLLQRIQMWEHKYEQGEIYATRKYLNKRLEHEDLVVQYLHRIPFSVHE